MPAVNALFLATVMYRFRLVPRIIPLMGLVGAPLLFASSLATMFGGCGADLVDRDAVRPADRGVGVLARRVPDRQGHQASGGRHRRPGREPRARRVTAMEQHNYDVVIVGGGAAGLSAALVLGRARRTVAVIDAGAPRNAPAAHMQGFLSRDGMPPADFLAAGREEVTGYGVEIIDDAVTQIEPGFVVHLASGEHVGGPPHPRDDRCQRRPARHSRCARTLGPHCGVREQKRRSPRVRPGS